MPGLGVIPSIRVRNMAEALPFNTGQLKFTVQSGGDDAHNSSLRVVLVDELSEVSLATCWRRSDNRSRTAWSRSRAWAATSFPGHVSARGDDEPLRSSALSVRCSQSGVAVRRGQ
jgi:hypothetical protein